MYCLLYQATSALNQAECICLWGCIYMYMYVCVVCIMYYKGPSCLKLVRKFLISIHFEPGGFMKLL